MRIGLKLLFFIVPFMFLVSCSSSKGARVKEITNIHNTTTIKQSKVKHDKESERRKAQRKANRERWKQQMSKRYSN